MLSPLDGELLDDLPTGLLRHAIQVVASAGEKADIVGRDGDGRRETDALVAGQDHAQHRGLHEEGVLGVGDPSNGHRARSGLVDQLGAVREEGRDDGGRDDLALIADDLQLLDDEARQGLVIRGLGAAADEGDAAHAHEADQKQQRGETFHFFPFLGLRLQAE